MYTCMLVIYSSRSNQIISTYLYISVIQLHRKYCRWLVSARGASAPLLPVQHLLPPPPCSPRLRLHFSSHSFPHCSWCSLVVTTLIVSFLFANPANQDMCLAARCFVAALHPINFNTVCLLPSSFSSRCIYIPILCWYPRTAAKLLLPQSQVPQIMAL